MRINKEREKEVLELRARGASLATIGKHCGGLTREAIRLNLRGYERKGVVIVVKKNAGEVGAVLGIKRSTVIALARRLQIVRDKSLNNWWMFSDEDVGRMRDFFHESRNTCSVCSKPIQGTFEERITRKACPGECTRKRNVKRNMERLTALKLEPARAKAVKLTGWHCELKKRLADMSPPDEGSRKLACRDACAYTGITKTQLRSLVYLRLIQVGFHPIRKWRGKPLCQFFVDELTVVKECYATAKK